MDLLVFERTAKRAEKLANENFPRYKFQLVLFALLGYVVIFSAVGLALGSLVGLGYLAFAHSAWLLLLLKKKIFLLIIPVLWILLKSCWIRVEEPEGLELKQRDYPELFNEINEIGAQLNAPKIHRVVLTPEMNAAITQTPRLGIFGWHKNTLVLGIELLLVLSAQQTRSVIAHEFGHLSGNHCRFNGWIYRVRVTWHQIMEAFGQQNSLGGALMGKFFEYYAPRFAAYSFVLARANEYEADSIAVGLTSKQAVGAALVSTYIMGPTLENSYWRDFFKLADDNPQPISLPWSGLGQYLVGERGLKAQQSKALAQVLRVETSCDDTHPALSERLKAIGYIPQTPPPVTISAAKTLLGDNYTQAMEYFDQQWLGHASQIWQQRYDHVVQARQTLAELSEKSLDELSQDQYLELCVFTEDLVSHHQGLAMMGDFQRKYPDSAFAAFLIGQDLFERQNEGCIAQFDIAVTEPSLVIESCHMAYQFLRSSDEKKAQEWLVLANEQESQDEMAQLERCQLSPQDSLSPVEIDAPMKSEIIAQLSANESIKSAWLAQKNVVYYQDSPMLTIAVKTNGFFFSGGTAMAKVETLIDIDVSYIIVPHVGNYKKLTNKIIKCGDLLF